MKPRRDITLGEMQDECNIKSCNECNFSDICMFYKTRPIRDLSLTDPPRFNEQQMAFWEGWYVMGARVILQTSSADMVSLRGEGGIVMGTLLKEVFPSEMFDSLPLDLAELLGKDAT